MKIRGSITVFLALMLACLFSAFFAFLEAARVSGLKANVQMCTMQAKDGLLASYSRPLWENYQLMFWEGSEGDFPQLSLAGSLQQNIVEGNWEDFGIGRKNYYVFPVHLTKVEVQGYQLATDHGGAAFRAQAADRMKQNIAENALKAIMEVITQRESNQDEERAARQEQAAMDTLENLLQKKSSHSGSSGQLGSVTENIPGSGGENVSGSGAENISGNGAENVLGNGVESVSGNVDKMISENPIQWMKDVKENGIFAFLMPEEDISHKEIELSDSVSKRKLQEGTITESERADASQKMLFHLYLSSNFSDVTGNAREHALDYEMEYLIAGKSSDKANLTAVVNRLLLLREAANMVYLESNPQKQQEALAIAAMLTTAFGQPELAEPVKHGILAAWAYAESLSDVRILLDGGKVSLVKTDEQWHTQLSSLSSSVMENNGKQQQNGLSYEGYLQVLMWTVSDEKLAERAMTLMEKDTGVRMDRMVCRMNCSYEYEAGVLFWRFVSLGDKSFSKYRFMEEASFAYF